MWSNNSSFCHPLKLEDKHPTFIRGVETILKVEGPDLMGSTRSGIRWEFYSSVLATAWFLKAFGIRTNGIWSFIVSPLSRNVLNNMSLWSPISIHLISSCAQFNLIFMRYKMGVQGFTDWLLCFLAEQNTSLKTLHCHYFCLITFLLKTPQWDNESDKHLSPKGLLWIRNL